LELDSGSDKKFFQERKRGAIKIASKILKFELIGALFIIFLGSFLHFTFEWSEKFWLLGIFSAVNESI